MDPNAGGGSGLIVRTTMKTLPIHFKENEIRDGHRGTRRSRGPMVTGANFNGGACA